MSTINLFNRWQVSKKKIWITTAIVVVGLIIIIPLRIFNSAQGYRSSNLLGLVPVNGDNAGFFEESPDFDDGEFTTTSAKPQMVTERQIIRNGDINMAVEDTRDTRENIKNMVQTMHDQGAFVITSVENSGSKNNPYINMTIRVPVDQFDKVMDALDAMAIEVSYRNENSEDVTAQFIDVQNRIESLEAARQRLLNIMLEADTTEDLLFAEAQLTIREVELESLKGQLKFLSESAALSRISINLEPNILSQPLDSSWNPSETVRKAVENLIDSFENFVDLLIFFGIASLPWFLFYGLIIYLGIRVYRRRKNKNEVETKPKKKQ